MKNPMSRLRSEKGLSRPKFAMLAGLTACTVANVELGIVQKLSFEVATKLEWLSGE